MNAERRKRIDAVIESINKIKDQLVDIRCEISDIKDGEEEAMNNLPESMQDGDRGQAMQDAIDAIDEAYSAIMDDSIIDLDEAVSRLEAAKGE